MLTTINGEHSRGYLRNECNIIPADKEFLKNSLQDVIIPQDVHLKEVEEFLSNKCEILSLNNCSVIMVDQDHTYDRTLNPLIESIASAKNTKAILVEYFRPELLKNAQSFPVLGKLLEKLFDSQIGVTYRTNISDKLADLAKLTNKVIAVSDIACNPQYFYAYGGISTTLALSSGFVPELLPLTLAYSTMWGVNRVQEFITHSGHFDINQIHQYYSMPKMHVACIPLQAYKN